MSRLFQFKQFSVDDSGAAMKVGTDAVLLGCLAEQQQVKQALDIGTGSGVIALMLAQRYPSATVEAIEINLDAVRQAAANFQQSKWRDRIILHHADVNHWKTDTLYDLICCNPPFYAHGYKVSDDHRKQARQQSSLSFRQLAQCFKQWLKPSGSAWIILPVQEKQGWEEAAMEAGLVVVSEISIVPNARKPPNRLVVGVALHAKPEVVHKQVIQIREINNTYSDVYLKLTGEFYLFA